MNVLFVARCAVIILLWNIMPLVCMDSVLVTYGKEIAERVAKASLYVYVDSTQSTRVVSLAEAKNMYPNFNFSEETTEHAAKHFGVGDIIDTRVKIVSVIGASILKGADKISIWLPYEFILRGDPAISMKEEGAELVTFSCDPSKMAALRYAVACKIETELRVAFNEFKSNELTKFTKSFDEMQKKHSDDLKEQGEHFRADYKHQGKNYSDNLDNEKKSNGEQVQRMKDVIEELQKEVNCLRDELRKKERFEAANTSISQSQLKQKEIDFTNDCTTSKKAISQLQDSLNVAQKNYDKIIWQKNCLVIITIFMTCLTGLLMGYISKHRLLAVA